MTEQQLLALLAPFVKAPEDGEAKAARILYRGTGPHS